jgi:hypothetical protein
LEKCSIVNYFFLIDFLSTNFTKTAHCQLSSSIVVSGGYFNDLHHTTCPFNSPLVRLEGAP